MKIVVVDYHPTPKSSKRCLIQTHSSIVVNTTLYSTLLLEVTTMGFFLLNNDIYEEKEDSFDHQIELLTDEEARTFWNLENLTNEEFARLGDRHPGIRYMI